MTHDSANLAVRALQFGGLCTGNTHVRGQLTVKHEVGICCERIQRRMCSYNVYLYCLQLLLNRLMQYEPTDQIDVLTQQLRISQEQQQEHQKRAAQYNIEMQAQLDQAGQDAEMALL